MKTTQESQQLVDKRVIQFFASLADETRLKILLGLTDNPKTVNEIHDYVGREKISLSGISHQLKFLSNIEMVHHKRNGKEKIFKLSDDFCWCIIKDVFKHFDGNLKKFNDYDRYPKGKPVKRGGGKN